MLSTTFFRIQDDSGQLTEITTSSLNHIL